MGSFADNISRVQATCPELDSTSAVAEYAKMTEAFSGVIDNTLSEIASSENIINNNISNLSFGKSGYYQTVALAYQEGDNLTTDPITGKSIYSVIDPTKQIIKQAAFIDVGMVLKVARLNPFTGLLDALTPDQLIAFKAYMTVYEIPGLPLQIVSLGANIFTFSTKITYYGTFNYATLKTNVETTLTTFRDTFTFNGILYINDLEDYIKQNVSGVRNAYFSNTKVDGINFSEDIALASGYFDFGTDFSTITYTAI